MNPHGELLDEFTKKEEDKMIDERLEIEYHKLFNGIKSENVKKKAQRSKLKLELEMLKGNFSKPMKLKESHVANEEQNYENIQPITSKSRSSIVNSSSFTNMLFLSHFDDNNNQEIFMQKKAMIEMERTSLMEEIDSLVKMINNLRQEKLTAKEELKILTTKEKEMMIIVNEVLGGIEELYTMTKEQKEQNENNKLFYEQHLKKLNVKIKEIAKENTEYAQEYKQINESTMEKHNTSFLDTILSWKSEENKLKNMENKLYTKGKLEEMLRALYVINRLAGLNYGNIIEHLIKIAEGEKEGKEEKKCLSEKSNKEKSDDEIELYIDAKSGQELSIKDLIERLEENLLTSAECRLLSKHQIIRFYEKNHHVDISSLGHGTSNLSEKTQQIIRNIIQHHEKLTSWFSRIEKRNQQLSEYYQSLIKIDDELEKEIKTIEMSSEQKSITYLQAREGQICNLEKVLHQECKVIFQFNINMYDLIKRFQNLNKFFDQLVKSADKSNRYKKTFVESENDAMFLKNITKTLFKSPESINLDWNKVIKKRGANNLTISMNTTLSSNFGLNCNDGFFEKASESEAYFETVMKNDLLRIYAQPSLYDPKKSYIDNVQETFEYVLKEETEIVQKLSEILKELMIFSKNGIEEVSSKRLIDQRGSERKLECSFVSNNLKKEEKKRNSNENKRRESLSLDKVNPLLQLLQKSNNDLKLDQFFTKDEVKEEQDTPKQNNYYIEQKELHEKPIFDSNINNSVEEQQDNFCIESNDYYRRDNFKIIEKLEKLNLKKRGLLRNVPFFNDTTLELEPTEIKTLNRTMTEKEPLRLGTARKSNINIRSPRISHQLSESRYNILSERRERESSRKKDLKLLLANISNIASCMIYFLILENQKYRIKKRINLNETMTSASISRINFSSSK